MDTYAWLDRVEAAVDEPADLEELRVEAKGDPDLTGDDAALVDGRIATYLADCERESGEALAGP